MEECKKSRSRDRKTFPAKGNVKETLLGGGNNVPVSTRAFPSLVMQFSDGKLKQDSLL